ncbi:MAG: ABC transporter ATP-binding protein [Clostridiales bacterium]|nr:ABC transporter ATP-binding protein [Clostridiales bacterium]
MELILKNVSASYGHNKVLDDISLTIGEGETVFIGGRNGSGKTTLLRIMSGLMEHEGSVTVAGEDVSKMKRRNVARLIALMPQTGETYFQYTVYQTVLLGRFARSKGVFGNFDAEDREFAKAAMDNCGVYEYRDRLLNELSGGQLQRVLLARTFAQGTPFLFLDEPGSNLDIKYRAELCDYLCKWAEGKTSTPYGDVRNTVVAVFHDLGQARSVCSRTVFLKNGKIAADGPSLSVITPESLESVYDFDVAGYIDSQVIIR